MKSTARKPQPAAPQPDSKAKHSAAAEKEDEKDKSEDASANPLAPEMDGGRKGSLDGKFEADHRPSR